MASASLLAFLVAVPMAGVAPPADGPQSRLDGEAAPRVAQSVGYTCVTPQGSCALSFAQTKGAACTCPISGRPVAGTVQ